MERHLSHSALAELFSGKAARPDVDAAVPHLAHCPECLDLAAGAIAELKRDGRLAATDDARSVVVALLAEEARDAESRLRARAAWVELKGLSPEEQIERIRAEPRLQTQQMFEVVVEEAANVAPHDPFLSEETALVAHALADCLPAGSFSEALRNDRRGEAMEVVANCRRLAADWRSSAAALGAARKHLDQGTGDPAREARLLSLQASLASDTGRLEQAQALLVRASALHRETGDHLSLARVTVKTAGTLMAAGRHEEAIARAEEALRLLSSRETRLAMLARNIITESLVFLGRPAAALRSHIAARPLREQHRQRRTDLQTEYLEALLLDSLGHAREAEKAFRSNVASRMEAEHYKDAFLTLLTRFELLFRRGEVDKAARVCKEALGTVRQAACHDQMEELWRRLLEMSQAGQLTELHLLAARSYLVRHWNAPARRSPLEGVWKAIDVSEAAGGGSLSREAGEGRGGGFRVGAEDPLPIPPPRWRAGEGATPHLRHFEGDDYEAALGRHDRALIEVGLAQCGGHFGETARLLGISRTTLRTKIVRYGLTASLREAASEEELLEDDSQEVAGLRARAWWAGLRTLSTAQQISSLETVLALRTRELFEVILEDATASALADPRRAEGTASVAYVLAGLLPRNLCPVPVKHDLQCAARLAAVSSLRLAGDWRGSAAALEAARSHLDRGTGDPAPEARLLSVQASLAADMGQPDEALNLLARAAALYRSIEDAAGVASTAIKEAGALLAAGRHAEAMSRARDALRLLPPRELRLELLTRSLITECLALLDRPAEALRSLQAVRPLYEQLRGPHTEHRLTYLEALVLDALGLEREAEAVFRASVAGRMEAGHSKDAFLTLLTRIELRFRRGELDRAAVACEEAIAVMSGDGEDRHAQAIELFRDLLPVIEARRLTGSRMLEARHALVRCWASPDPPAPAPADRRDRTFVAPEPPPVPARLAPGDYEAAMEGYEREVILAALAQAEGRISETCRLLGLSRNTLRERMSRYGLRE